MITRCVTCVCLTLAAGGAAAQQGGGMDALIANLTSFETRAGYLGRFERFFRARDVDAIPGLSDVDRRMHIDANIARMRGDALKRLASNDRNGDGQVTRDEVIATIRDTFDIGDGTLSDADQRRIDTGLILFMKPDTDGDRIVTEGETLAFAQRDIDKMLRFETLVFDGLTAGLDRDGDGVVVFDDVVHGFDTLLPRLDTDGDGQITSREQKNFSKAL